jgi:type II restriction/modification system DNA methylase subunit YeeA
LIHEDLTSGDGEENTNITQAKILWENAKTSFIGTHKSGAFDVTGELARQWLNQPNPHEQPNSQVVKSKINGMDITRRSSDTWIIDFGIDMSEQDASLYEKPFEHISRHVYSSLIKKQSDWQTNGKNTKHLENKLLIGTYCGVLEQKCVLLLMV